MPSLRDFIIHQSKIVGRAVGLIRNALTNRARESEAIYRALASVAFDGMAVHAEGVLRQATRPFEELFGSADRGLVGRPVAELVVEEQREFFQREFDQSHVIELECRREDGRHFHIEAFTHACRFQGEPAYAMAVRDISVRKRDLQAIRHQADFDALTGLPNRMLFFDRLSVAIEQATRDTRHLAVMFLDLDRFKNVNDDLGHNVGDLLLFEVADRLQGCLRTGDMVSRLGGDEFTVLLRQVDGVEDATVVAQRIVKAVNEPYLIQEQSIGVGVSVGIAIFPQHGQSADGLIRAADSAMYQAKDDGRRHLQLYSADNEGRHDKLALEGRLRKGIEAREFVNYYQPRIELRTGRIEGAEALLRWQHAELGLVMPDDFIPLAEETLLILPLGAWVLNEACRQAKAWEGHGTRVSINLSPLQLYDPSLIEAIDAAVAASLALPSQIEFEITENAAMKNMVRTLAILHELTSRGFSVSLDDFGKGYSSLNYLKQFPVSTIKIDIAFIRDVLKDPKDAAIVRAIISLGHNLGMQVLAEGVEEEGQACFLLEQGCDLAQGFLYSKPVPAGQFDAMLEQRRAAAA